jgi:hypothetical protein
MPTPAPCYPFMPRLGLGIHEYSVRAQLLAKRVVVGIAMSATKLVDGKAEPCHDGMLAQVP